MYPDMWCLGQEKSLVPFLELQAELAAFIVEYWTVDTYGVVIQTQALGR